MRVVFLGNHTVGINAIKALEDEIDLIGIVAHPPDIEDGLNYESVFDYAILKNIPVIRGSSKEFKTQEFISQLKPDLIWVTDYKYILPTNLIKIAPLGAINIHPSLLPKYRGRAAINWAVINGENEFGLTAHYIDEGVDTGDIIEQFRIPIGDYDYISDLLERSYPLYYDLTKYVIKKVKGNSVNRVVQCHENVIYPKRCAEDGQLNWEKPAKDIINLIRAVSKPYPGAFSYIFNSKIYIWRAENFETKDLTSCVNGEVLYTDNQNSIIIKCSDGYIKVTDFTFEKNSSRLLKKGDILKMK